MNKTKKKLLNLLEKKGVKGTIARQWTASFILSDECMEIIKEHLNDK